jgi:hypothetical protein
LDPAERTRLVQQARTLPGTPLPPAEIDDARGRK